MSVATTSSGPLAQTERREERFQINPQYEVRVAVRGENRAQQEIRGKVLDLSSTGARLALDSPLQFQEEVTVYLNCPQMGLDISLCGNICWQRPGRNGEYVLGCAFDPKLPADYLEDFFRNGLLERRDSPRIPVSVAGRAQWELAPESVDVSVINVSQCGFCIRTREQVATGRRLRLFVERSEGDTMQLDARIQWSARYGNEQLLGCHVINNHGYDTVAELASVAQQRESRGRGTGHNAWRLAYYAVLVSLLGAGAAWIIWWQSW